MIQKQGDKYILQAILKQKLGSIFKNNNEIVNLRCQRYTSNYIKKNKKIKFYFQEI